MAEDLIGLYRADPSQLSFDSTIAREVLHKWAVEAVMMTDSCAVDDDEFLCAGILPRVNSPAARALSARWSRYNFPALFELARQATLVVTHRHLDVPNNWATLLFEMSLELADTSLTGPMTRPVTSISKVHVARKLTKRGRLTGAEFTLTVFAEHRPLARVRAVGQITQPEKYKLARQLGREARMTRIPAEPTQVTPVDPALVGLRPGSSTLIGPLRAGAEPGRFEALVRVDFDDLFYFDHPISHVSGVISCEALRQAALIAACSSDPGLSPDDALVRSFAAKFAGYAEPDIDIELEVSLGEASSRSEAVTVPVQGALTQLGDPIVTASFELEFPADGY